ncbi:MAG TPA: cytochrome c3 family protein [Aquabacterium sp.]|uniref:cytochrome c3 family protein n=1 Tax=Aquabacterium sp. TaxID=1872578 RepID=UPI002E37A12F|nr:cytochrome c3 family protein [Aquabacterium sp.]HEX5372735.1 cytochrome c3 family protein [Aquabacterium sp.]
MRTDALTRLWYFTLVCVLSLAGCLGVHAQSIESVLAPGELIAGHVKVENDCSSCHVRFNPKGQDALCMACHKEVGQDIKTKQGFHGRLKGQPTCRSCHTDHKGRQARIVDLDRKHFDHRQSDYLLKGKHQEVACDKCHVSGRKYWQAPMDCLSCHKKDDVHKSGLGGKCADCHHEFDWKDARFDHDKKTRFALLDKHDQVKCDDCHANGRYKDTPRTCVGCHKDDDDKKGHKGRYGTQCESCHKASSWKDLVFNHDVDTDYPLRGKHRKVECSDCHTGPLYKQKLPQQCWACHKQDDKHKETLGRDCASCHSESSWKDPPRFDHAKTRFPLLGKHLKTDCKDCHKSALYKEAPTDCFACHQKDDKHEGTLGKACADCHAEKSWKTTEGRFDHDRTKFALRNAHASSKVACSDCHKGGLKHLRGTPVTCVSCHKKDDKHEGTQGPLCEQCHGDKDWKATAFDHAKTRFPLTGRHRDVVCSSCHATKRFKDVRLECVSCHLKADQHKGKFGTRCESCHNARHWRSWEFNHDRQTRYPLTGSHARARCEACHTRPAPAGRSIADVGQRCVDCHLRDDPHDGEFGQRCDQCHSTGRWIQIDKRFSLSSE